MCGLHGYQETPMGGIVLLFQTQCVYNEHPSWGWDGEDQVTEGQSKLSLEWNGFLHNTGMKHEYSGTTLIRPYKLNSWFLVKSLM